MSRRPERIERIFQRLDEIVEQVKSHRDAMINGTINPAKMSPPPGSFAVAPEYDFPGENTSSSGESQNSPSLPFPPAPSPTPSYLPENSIPSQFHRQFVSSPPPAPPELPLDYIPPKLDPEQFPMPPSLASIQREEALKHYEALFENIEQSTIFRVQTRVLKGFFLDKTSPTEVPSLEAISASYLALCYLPHVLPELSLDHLVSVAGERYGVDPAEIEYGLKKIVGYHILPGLENPADLSAFLLQHLEAIDG